ncbi:22247_t:CDS:2, partial [Rhizophagus irregularis]
MTRHHRKKSFLSQTQYDIRGKVRAVTLYMFFDIGQGEMINGNSSTTRTWHFS